MDASLEIIIHDCLIYSRINYTNKITITEVEGMKTNNRYYLHHKIF